MGGVDHDGLAEFFSDRTGRRFRRIGRAKNFSDFAHRVLALINDGNAFLAAWLLTFVGRTAACFCSRHELDDLFPRAATFSWPKFLFENGQHWAVKLLRLGHAHAMDLESDDVETSA